MIYLASPYTSPVASIMNQRFEENCHAVAVIAKNGQNVYSPVVHFHPVSIRHELPRDFDFWRQQNFAILRHCQRLWILKLDGWSSSRGVEAEENLARTLDIPTRRVTLEGLLDGSDLL